MRHLLLGAALVAAFACSPGGTPDDSRNTPAAMTDSADAASWRTLFDGTSTAAWRGFQMESLPTGWQVEDGSLVRAGGGGDIITRDQFGDFELELEWKVADGGNSGIMYRVTEADSSTYRTGPEYQVLDDAAHPDGGNRLTSAGSAYGLYAAPAGVVKPAGEWNAARIVARGAHVEHWLNGQKVVEYELWSPDWEAKVKASKFVEWPGYGRSPRGHVALQDHGDRVEFRNIRIREM
ncbi:MAG TPA: DUF1080 domain-containing protein [Gemmatimonadales bacterium]